MCTCKIDCSISNAASFEVHVVSANIVPSRFQYLLVKAHETLNSGLPCVFLIWTCDDDSVILPRVALRLLQPSDTSSSSFDRRSDGCMVIIQLPHRYEMISCAGPQASGLNVQLAARDCTSLCKTRPIAFWSKDLDVFDGPGLSKV